MARRIDLTQEEINNLPKSRPEAKLLGKKFFYSGSECSKGHITYWNTSRNRCMECLREQGKKDADKRRRRLGVKVQNKETPLPKGEVYKYLTSTGEMKTVRKDNHKKKRNIKLHEVVCSCGDKIWIGRSRWKVQESCRKCADKLVGIKNRTHGLSNENIYSIYQAAKLRAKKANNRFNIKVEDIHCPEFCPVLGIKIDYRPNKGSNRRPSDASPSLDQIKPSKGYTKDNIMLISYRANTIKKDGTYEEHMKIAEFYEKYEI